MKRLTLFLSAVLVFPLLSACGGTDDVATESVINRGLSGDVESFDPQTTHSKQAHIVLEDLYQGLVEYSADGQIVPGVATDWSLSDDQLTYTFRLRDNAKWSNGDAVTSDHFLTAFRRLVTPATAAFYADFLRTIENAPEILAGDMSPEDLGVSAPDPLTLEVTLTRQVPYFLQLLTHTATSPLHPTSLATAREVREESEPRTLPITNGAYKLDRAQQGFMFSLSRNEHYWDKANVAIDKVNWHVIVNSTSEYNRFRAGELDVTSNISPGQFEMIAREHPDELMIGPFLGLYYYGLNLTKPPFADNPKLRRALSLAVDREALVSKVIGRGEVAAYSWVPPGIVGYEPATFDYADLDRDAQIAEARRVYQEAGYGPDNPVQFELRYNTSDTQQKVALAIQAMWREVLGADVTLHNEEFRVLISNIQGMEITQSYRLSWIGDYSDPETFLQLMKSGHESNLTGYSNPAVDALLSQAAQEASPEKRFALMREAEALALEDHPAIPLYYYVSKHLVRNTIDGWEHNILDRHPNRHLSISAQPPN